MTYLDREATVVYISRNGKKMKIFTALGWLANLCSRIPNKRSEQMARYDGHYSNVLRGRLNFSWKF